MAMSAVAVTEMGRVRRIMRNPEHRFELRARPFQITPFMIAPVLPGETMKNALLQARVVTDPIKNPLIGWWQEYYLFYVKHRDLADRDDLVSMMLEPDFDMSGHKTGATSTDMYTFKGSVDWVQMCYERVVEEYFRDEGEAWDSAKVGNYALASVQHKDWTDSLILDSAFDTGGSPQDGTESLDDLNVMMQQWEFMRSMKMTDMSYEDYLRTYGVSIPKPEEMHRPELIRYVRDWTYPSNTIDPTDGSAASACSWAVAERADKDRLFKEPGFVFGVTVSRPKIYFSKTVGHAAGVMDNALAWLPAIMRDEVYTSLKKIAAGNVSGNGPIPSLTSDYWIDIRDLLIYGDQFVNFALTETNAGLAAVPTTGMVKKYVASADMDALFAGASPANQVRQDGVCRLSILGTQQDHT